MPARPAECSSIAQDDQGRTAYTGPETGHVCIANAICTPRRMQQYRTNMSHAFREPPRNAFFYLGAANRRVRTYAVYVLTWSRTIKRLYTAPQTEPAPMSRFGNAHSQHKQSPDSLPKRVVLSCDTGTQPNGVPHKRRHIETWEIHAPNGAHACHLTRF